MPAHTVKGEAALVREIAKLEAAGERITQILAIVGGAFLILTESRPKRETR